MPFSDINITLKQFIFQLKHFIFICLLSLFSHKDCWLLQCRWFQVLWSLWVHFVHHVWKTWPTHHTHTLHLFYMMPRCSHSTDYTNCKFYRLTLTQNFDIWKRTFLCNVSFQFYSLSLLYIWPILATDLVILSIQLMCTNVFSYLF